MSGSQRDVAARCRHPIRGRWFGASRSGAAPVNPAAVATRSALGRRPVAILGLHRDPYLGLHRDPFPGLLVPAPWARWRQTCHRGLRRTSARVPTRGSSPSPQQSAPRWHPGREQRARRDPAGLGPGGATEPPRGPGRSGPRSRVGRRRPARPPARVMARPPRGWASAPPAGATRRALGPSRAFRMRTEPAGPQTAHPRGSRLPRPPAQALLVATGRHDTTFHASSRAVSTGQPERVEATAPAAFTTT
jgi:hypothetical protein